MSNVSFNVIDAGYRLLYPDRLRVFWVLNQTGSDTAGHVISKRSVAFTPNAQGDVTCSVADNESMWDATYYKLEFEYLDAGDKLTKLEAPDWEIRVPGGSHDLVNLIKNYTSPFLTWIGTSYPDPLTAFWLIPGEWALYRLGR